LDPADTNATRNAEIIDQDIARLVDSLRQLQQLANALAAQRQQLNALLDQLKGRIPKPKSPPGAAGDDDQEDLQPGDLAGQAENPVREGEQLQMPLSPNEAAGLLESLPLDDRRRLSLTGQESGRPDEKKGRNW
jgi:small-conductance mechanosensitive channel